ncbi:odorant receptor 46a [Drosophila grimshawi]|uniref:Odorant receptor n=1 Tax=Drosophila grimshawi TaxID=7222 RepID=B4J6V2_DROGR|nr:odorant receptor 46a [Drosophila grimshawi]EDW02033.1 GH20123 [Drosophila grimshawi]
MQQNFDWSVELFYKAQERILYLYSVWPHGVGWGRVLHRIRFWLTLCFWILLFDLILSIYIVLNITDLNEIMKAFFLLATCIAYTVVHVKFNDVSFLQIIANLQDAQFCSESAEEQRIFVVARELSRVVRNRYGVISVMSLVTVQITQYIIDNTELPVSTYDPFDGAHGSLGYWVMYFYQCVAMSMACFFNISFDSLCCSLFIFVRCQLDILALRLQSIGHNCNGVEESVEEVEHQLKNCIRLHMKIVELAADIEAVLYLPMSIQIMFSVLVLTSGFYAISLLSDEKLIFLKFFIYQSCMLTQVFVLCYFPGEVAQRSLKLSHDLYKSNWVNWQRSNRRLLLMLMQRLDIPIRIRTLDASLGFDLALFTSLIICHMPYAMSLAWGPL